MLKILTYNFEKNNGNVNISLKKKFFWNGKRLKQK